MDYYVDSEDDDDETPVPSSSSASLEAGTGKGEKQTENNDGGAKRKRPRKRKPPNPGKEKDTKDALPKDALTTEVLEDVLSRLDSLGFEVRKKDDDDSSSVTSQNNRGGRGSYRGNRGGRGGFERGRGNERGRGGYDRGRGGPDRGRGGNYRGQGGSDRGRGGQDQGRGGFERGRGGPNQGRGGYYQEREDQGRRQEGTQEIPPLMGMRGFPPGRGGGGGGGRGGQNQMQGGGRQPMKTSTPMPDEGATGDGELVWRIFRQILHECKGRALFSKARAMFPNNFSTNEILDWCHSHQQKFLIFENDHKEVTYIGIRHFRCRLCFHYNQNGCTNAKCTYLHACQAYVKGHCANGPTCKCDHHFESPHNKNALTKMGLTKFDSNEVRTIVQCSNLQACSNYNREKCDYSSSCYRLHVCEKFIEDTCDNEMCKLSHDFSDLHSQKLLHMFGLDKMKSEEVIKKNIYVTLRPFQQNSRGGRGRNRGGRGRGGGGGRGSRHASRQGSRQQSRRNSDEEEEDDFIPAEDASDPTQRPMKISEFMKMKRSQQSSEGEVLKPSSIHPSQQSSSRRQIDDDDDSDDGSYYSYHTAQATPAHTTPMPQLKPHLMPQAMSPRPKPLPTPRTSVQSRNTENILNGSDIPICLKFVTSLSLPEAGICNGTCGQHHIKGMYQWQVNIFGSWATLKEENEQIEKNYSNPDITSLPIKVFSKIIGLEGQRLKLHFTSTEEMTGEMLEQGVKTIDLEVRRLSTLPGSNPNEPSTKWMWYYQGESGWHKYDYSARLQLDKVLLEGRPLANLMINDTAYGVSFKATRWYQYNTLTQTQRDICRRPKKFISERAVLDGQWSIIGK